MKANPKTYYNPENIALFAASTAEILTGATTFNALPYHQKEELKYSFTPVALDYFSALNIAPTLDNVLKHQEQLRKVISEEVDFINSEIEEMEMKMEQAQEEEGFLGLGKKARARRAAKRSADVWSTQGNWDSSKSTSVIPSGGTNTSTGRPTTWTGEKSKVDSLSERAGTDNPRWKNTLTDILGVALPVMGVIQANKQNQQQQQQFAQQQSFLQQQQPPQKKKILGLEPVVGIALILVFLVLIAFSVWQISKNNSQ